MQSAQTSTQKRGRKKGSKNRPKAREIVEALFYIADALAELNRRIPELRTCIEDLKEVKTCTPKSDSPTSPD